MSEEIYWLNSYRLKQLQRGWRLENLFVNWITKSIPKNYCYFHLGVIWHSKLFATAPWSQPLLEKCVIYHYLESRTQSAFPLYGECCAVHLRGRVWEVLGLQLVAMIYMQGFLTWTSIHKRAKQTHYILSRINKKTGFVTQATWQEIWMFVCWANTIHVKKKKKVKRKGSWTVEKVLY